MRFDFDLTVTAATTQSAPAQLEARLVRGTLKRVEIFFPPGCASWVYAIIRDGLHQIAPANPGGSFNADGATIGFEMNYQLEANAHLLMCELWSPLCRYNHIITFRFDVNPEGESDNAALLAYLGEMLLIGQE
jgi:hypothetical protein